MKVKNKKGSSGHIEIIISFLIFISFVIFLFSVFPVYKSGKSKVGLDSAEYGVLNFTDAHASYLTLILNRTVSNCFYVDVSGYNLSRVIVKDDSEKGVNATINTKNEFYVNNRNNEGRSKRIFQIYSSPYFVENSGGLDKCDNLAGNKDVSYGFGLKRELRAYSYGRFLDLNDSYTNGYAKLKKEFGVPDREEFGFIVHETNGREILRIMIREPQRAEVLGKEIPMQMFYNNGTSVFVILNIRAW